MPNCRYCFITQNGRAGVDYSPDMIRAVGETLDPMPSVGDYVSVPTTILGYTSFDGQVKAKVLELNNFDKLQQVYNLAGVLQANTGAITSAIWIEGTFQ